MKILVRFCILSLVILCGISILSSCSNKKSTPMFTTADTLEVIAITEDCMNNLSAKNFDMAFAYIFNIGDDKLEQISEAERRELSTHFSAFPVLRYRLESMDFNNVYDVTVVYTYEFFDKPEGDNIPNTMTVTFKPQKLSSRWYLALEKKSVIE